MQTEIGFEYRTFRLNNAGDNHEFGVYTGAEMRENNRDYPELVVKLDQLGIGESFTEGGGAHGATVITRVS